MKKLFTLMFLLVASIGTMHAEIIERVQIGDLCYNLDTSSKTAKVTFKNGESPSYEETLTSVNIPNFVTYDSETYSVTSIGEYAFWACTGLTSVTIGNGVTSIEYFAFYGCSGLTSIDIPNSVTNIGYAAFHGVQNINYNGTATGIPWDALRFNGKIIYSVSDIRDIASGLPSGQTSEEYYLFAGVISSISEVNTTYGNATFTINDGITSSNTFYCYRIYDYYSTLFTNSNQLHIGDAVVISSKVKNHNGTTPEATQGRLVHHSANPLITPDSIFFYGHRMDNPSELKLYNAIDMDTLDIPSTVADNGQNYTVTEIASGAFYNRSNLKCVKIPETLKLLPRSFENCSNIQSLYYNAKNMEQYKTIPFAESSSTLQKIYIGEEVQSVPEHVFDNLANISYVEWNAVACEDMEYSPFYYSRENIAQFNITGNIERIPANLCWGVSVVDEYSIPSSVYYIGKDAFYGTNISEVNIPNTVQTVGGRAFANCPLTKVYWDVTNQEDYEIIDDVDGRITVSLDASNLDWNHVYLYAWNSNGAILSAWPGNAIEKDENGRYTYSFSSTYTKVSMIWNNGTDQTVDITDVKESTIYTLNSSSGTEITYTTRPLDGRLICPFYRSTDNITEFSVGENVARVPAQLCRDMKQITNMTLPVSVTAIGRAAFKGCNKLTSLLLRENITEYGDEAFYGCSALTSIYNYRERPVKLGENTFEGVDYFNCTLYVPEGSIDMYKSSASDWKDFFFIEPLIDYAPGNLSAVQTEQDGHPALHFTWDAVDGVEKYEIKLNLEFFERVPLNQDIWDDLIATNEYDMPFDENLLEVGTYTVKWGVRSLDGEENPISDWTYSTVQLIISEKSEQVEIINTNSHPTKLLRNGQILILRGDRTYTLTGAEVK